MLQGSTVSVLRLQEAWGLCAHGQQVVNILHLLWGAGFPSVRQLRKCASATAMWVLQRGATAEDTGEGLSREGPDRPAPLQPECGKIY